MIISKNKHFNFAEAKEKLKKENFFQRLSLAKYIGILLGVN